MRVDEVVAEADGTPAGCERCGADDDDLQQVWPASGTGESAELWCAGCREQYPHEADGEGDGDGDGEGNEADETDGAG